MSGSIAALDTDKRILYWPCQKAGATSNDPWYLVGLSLEDASVVSSALLCATDADVMWSLEYLPASA